MIFERGALTSQIDYDLLRVVRHADWSHEDLSDLEILVILLEDRRFFQHRGVDVLAIIRELIKLFTFQGYGGASTIDMQYVRTRTGYKERTFGRKIYEILLAYLLQKRMNKLEILRAYLEEMYLGSGIYGIRKCAKIVFNKMVYDLDRSEAAQVAAMMVYPRPLHPTLAWEKRVSRRALYGLKLFEKYGQQYTRRSE